MNDWKERVQRLISDETEVSKREWIGDNEYTPEEIETALSYLLSCGLLEITEYLVIKDKLLK